MISGVHAIVFAPAADEVRDFFRDILGLPNVDAGGGWLIFALPPAEVAVHPAERPSQEIYLMCDDLDATIASLAEKGVGLARPITDQRWGRVTAIALAGGTELGLYQPTHPRPIPSA
jgi:predicted enzyme related to lactoylglutathione lyase